MSSTTKEQNQQQLYEELEREYPGISKIRAKLSVLCQKKIGILAELIRYNVPRAYYTRDIMELDEIIQDIYDEGIERGALEVEAGDQLPAELMRKVTPISDEEEAEVILQCQRELSRSIARPSIAEIQALIRGFNKAIDSGNVDQILINTVADFTSCRKEKGVLENFQPKDKPAGNRNGYQKYQSRKEPSEKSDSVSKNKELVIVIGSKISNEVKEMRNCVKKASLDSFAVVSLQREKNKPQIEKEKTEISLSLNKVSRQNLSDIFRDILPLAIKDEELASTLVTEILDKCTRQPKMADTYLQFVRLFTKIPCSQFQWQWTQPEGKEYKENRINGVHRLLAEELEQMFKNGMDSQGEQKKKVKHITHIIGNLIRTQKLSRKIYTQVLNTLIEHIFASTEQKETQQICLEAIINLIDSLKEVYAQNWAEKELSQFLTPSNYESVARLVKIQAREDMDSMQELLNGMVNYCGFETSRIKCLIQNLFDRREPTVVVQKSQNAPTSTSSSLTENKIKQLLTHENGLSSILQLYSSNPIPHSLTKILLVLFDGSRAETQQNITQFLALNPIAYPEFHQFWQQEFLTFVDAECDLHFMVEGLARIMDSYGRDRDDWLIEEELDEEDQEMVGRFVDKLLRYLH